MDGRCFSKNSPLSGRHIPRSLSLLLTLAPFHLLSPQGFRSLNPTTPGTCSCSEITSVDIIKLRCDHTGVHQALDPVRLAGVLIRKGKGNTEENVTKTDLNTRSKAWGRLEADARGAPLSQSTDTKAAGLQQTEARVHPRPWLSVEMALLTLFDFWHPQLEDSVCQSCWQFSCVHRTCGWPLISGLWHAVGYHSQDDVTYGRLSCQQPH